MPCHLLPFIINNLIQEECAMAVKKSSRFYRLDAYDLLKGVIVAAGTAGLDALINILHSGLFPDEKQWKQIALAALCGASTYLLKNFLTNSDGQLLKGEAKAV